MEPNLVELFIMFFSREYPFVDFMNYFVIFSALLLIYIVTYVLLPTHYVINDRGKRIYAPSNINRTANALVPIFYIVVIITSL